MASSTRKRDTRTIFGLLLACVAVLVAEMLGAGENHWFQIAVSAAFPLVLIWLIAKIAQMQKQTLSQYVRLNLDSLNGSWLKAICFGVLAFLLDVGMKYLYLRIFPPPTHRPPSTEFIIHLSGIEFALITLVTVVIVPFSEEIFTRGFLQTQLQRLFARQTVIRWISRSGVAACLALVLSAAFFALGHGSIAHLPIYFAIGIIYGGIYLYTGSLYCTIFAHALNNAMCAFIIAFT